ncbi:MAG: phosphatase PAP2 family protein [Novosphingobium sp.]|nr:phosphatase PAP2 family protein [Novosphingobium sp.]
MVCGKKLLLRPLMLSVTLACTATPALASTKGWKDASDVARNVLVVAAIGVPAAQGDWDGVLQAGGSMAVTSGVTFAMKEAFPETRPDLSDRKSFPSGHTSVSFAAAATLHNRHGWKAGIPAHLAAAFVGLARVKADKHHWYDVVAGAAVGELTGLLLTNKRNPNVQMFPWADSKSAGVSMAMRF